MFLNPHVVGVQEGDDLLFVSRRTQGQRLEDGSPPGGRIRLLQVHREKAARKRIIGRSLVGRSRG